MIEKVAIRHPSTVLSALSFLGTLLCALCAPIGAQQPTKVFRLGILTFDVARSEPFFEAFFEELRRLGHGNIAVEFRNAEGTFDRLPNLAAELVRLEVSVIFASATGAALAAKNATRTIPIVFTAVSYPVGSGLVASLAQPGGNITGLRSEERRVGRECK